MEQFLLVHVAVQADKRKLEAKGLWHIPGVLPHHATLALVDYIIDAMRGWFALNLDKLGPKARPWHQYTPIHLDGEAVEAAMRECALYPLDSPDRFIDVRILNRITGRANDAEGK